MKAAGSFIATRAKAIARITEAMSSKLEDFGLSDYDWTTPHRADSPSMYLYELVNWLTTVIDSLALKDTYKEEAYSGAVSYIASCFLVRTDFSSLASYRTRTNNNTPIQAVPFPRSSLPSPCQRYRKLIPFSACPCRTSSRAATSR